MSSTGWFGFSEGKQIRLTFRITKAAGRHLLESPLSLNQQVVEVEEHYKISATVVGTERLRWWLRGFGDDLSEVRMDECIASSLSDTAVQTLASRICLKNRQSGHNFPDF